MTFDTILTMKQWHSFGKNILESNSRTRQVENDSTQNTLTGGKRTEYRPRFPKLDSSEHQYFDRISKISIRRTRNSTTVIL